LIEYNPIECYLGKLGNLRAKARTANQRIGTKCQGWQRVLVDGFTRSESKLRARIRHLILIKKIPNRSSTIRFPNNLAPNATPPRISARHPKGPDKILPRQLASKIYRQIR
jgi:hypothetical protein